MSQTAKLSESGTISLSTSPLWIKFLVIVGLAGAIAAAALFAAGAISQDRPASITQVEPAYSRLDDYGLRHPQVSVSSGQDSRLDDYALRHPQVSVSSGQDSRLDDYALRHPQVSVSSGQDSRLDDYGLRHPPLSRPAER